MTEHEIEYLQQRLASEGRKTHGFFQALNPPDWDRPVYTTGSAWRVRHVLAHFISAETGYLHYLRQAVAGGPGVPRDFDIDAFNEAEVPQLDRLKPDDLLSAFETAREETIMFVGGLTPADLERRGYHPWFGDGDLRFILKLIYRHPKLHLRDVRQALDSGSPVPHGEGYAKFARSDPPSGEESG